MSLISVVYHSGFGHTRRMAEQVSDGAESVRGATAELFDVEADGFDWSDLSGADAIVFGSPTYLGGLSGRFKTALDGTGQIWARQGWRDKLAAGFTVSSNASGDKLQTLLQMVVIACQHGMHWIGPGMMPGDPTLPNDPENINRLGSWVGAMALCRHEDGADLVASDAATARALGVRIAVVAESRVREDRSTPRITA